MSTKTLRKRIALVAVSALGAGLLSVVAIPAANAAADTFEIAIDDSTTGSASPNATIDSATSLGWISKTSTAGTQTGVASIAAASGAAVTGVIYPSAQISFLIGGNTTDGTGVSVVVTGGTLSSVSDSVGVEVLSGSGTTAVSVQASTTAAALIGIAKASSTVGSTMTIAAYSGTGINDLTTATAGTLLGIYTLTVASASASGVVSLADSYIFQQAAVAKGTVAAGSDRFDNSSRMANGSVGIIEVDLNDAFTANVTTGTLTATATNSATLAIASAASDTGAEAYAATTSFASMTPAAANYIYVNQPVANTAGSTTVTITHNGTVVATKTLNWSGDVASLTFDSANSSATFKNGATATVPAGAIGGVVYVAKDAAGNAVTLAAQPTVSNATGALVGATVYSGNVATSGGEYQTSAVGYGYTTMVVPSSILQGTGTYRLKLTNSAGTAIYSAVQTATVSHGTDSFSVSWDKASYASGEIATLTIKGKDVYGNAVATGVALAGLSLSTNTAGLSPIGSACTDASVFVEGAKTCKFAVLNESGSYAYSVDLDTLTAQSASVGTVAVTAASTGVTNADVLKAIVSLIASINKQIAALQKALLKK